MRNTFARVLLELARKDKSVFLLCGDVGYSVLEPFAEEFPERFLNVGIAEQNMIGVATGLSLEGYCVFVYSIGNFPTLRCMEQIRYDVCYHNANVKIIAVGGGYAYGPLSTSHHTTEELGMLRTIPNMVVTAPGDPCEVESMTAFMVSHKGPGYMRLNKTGEAKVHPGPPAFPMAGCILSVIEQTISPAQAVLATGDMVGYATKYIRENKSNADLYSCPFLNPIDSAQLAKLAQKYEKIITIEEHQLNGGLGSAVLERLNDLQSSKALKTLPVVERIAIPNRFVNEAGTQDYLREKMGLVLRLN